MSRPSSDADDLLVCADVLGAFGVAAADIRRSRTSTASDAEDDGLEAALADVLDDGRDRTTVLRRTIARSDRGFSCAARHATDDLERELTGVFEAIGWSFECERFEPLSADEREQLKLQAADYAGRQRRTTFEYPETPLGTDNLPAVLWTVNDILLSGTDARFVLLSAGVDRWQAALVDESELERLRERYGPRIAAVDRPLCPEHGVEAYVPDDPSASNAAADAEPWPAWAHERESDSGDVASGPADAAAADDVESLIEEAESGSGPGSGRGDETTLIEEAEPGSESGSDEGPATADSSVAQSSASASESATDPTEPTPEAESEPEPESAAEPTTAAPATEAGGYELCGGSPTVSRVADDGAETDDARSSRDDARAGDARESRRRSEDNAGSEGETEPAPEDEFGTLSGSTTSARVSNDSFGSDVQWETEDDRYRALGAALGAGGTVTVRGLLEDDDFLPELPAAEPEETRIAFEDPFDPAALREAKAAAEESGFVWVDSGSLETTRISNG